MNDCFGERPSAAASEGGDRRGASARSTDGADGTPTGHVVVANHSAERRDVDLLVDHGRGRLVAGRYRVPGGAGLRVERAFGPGRYTVRARLADGPWASMTWEPVDRTPPGPNADENAGVVVTAAGGLELVPNVGNDLKLGGTHADAYEPAGAHRVDAAGTTGD